MAVTTDIMRMYRTPRRVVSDLLAMGPREDRAVAYLMAGCLLVFIAQLPRLSRTAYIEETVQRPEDIVEGWSVFDRLVAYEFLAWIIVWPLIFYGIAAVLHLGRKAMGSDASAYASRLALFWAFLAAAPVGLLFGLTAAFVGPGLQTNIVGGIWLATFAIFTWQGMRAGGANGAAV